MDRKELDRKAWEVFASVLNPLSVNWAGPEYEFDVERFKARIDSGPLKKQIFYVTQKDLEDKGQSELQANLSSQVKTALQKN